MFAAIHTAEAQDQLLGKLGRLPTGAELYVAHRLGLGSLEVVNRPEQCPLIERFYRFFKGRRTQQGPSDT